MSWLDDLFDCFEYLFYNKKSVEKLKKHTMTLDEAMAKLEELNNVTHLEELAEIPYDVIEYIIENNKRNYPYRYCAKNIFKDNNILAKNEEINNFSKFKCDESETNGDKNYTVKTFYMRKDYYYYYYSCEDTRRKLRVAYYGDIQKYVLIVSTGYYDYISKPYDDLQVLRREVLTLADIIKLEKEIEEMKAKHLEETAWS